MKMIIKSSIYLTFEQLRFFSWKSMIFALILLFIKGVWSQECPEHEQTVKSHGTLGVVRNQNGTRGTPLNMTSGCTYNVFIPEGTEVYLILHRPTPTSHLVYTFNWQGENQQPSTIFSWEAQCCRYGQMHPHIDMSKVAIFGDWVVKPEFWKDVMIFPSDANAGEDVYHCYAACQGYYPQSWVGDLYITISTWLAYGSVEGTFSFEFEEPNNYIKEDQLAVVKELYDECCYPTQKLMPPGWLWEEHKQQVSSDPDRKTYCDWLVKTGWANFSTSSCDRIDNVFCDSEGNVQRLEVFQAGLQCRLPASLTLLTALDRLDLSTNKIYGSLPASLLTFPHLDRFSLERNSLTGTIPCPPSTSPVTSLSLGSNIFSGPLPACLAFATRLLELDVSANVLSGTLPPQLGELTNLVTLTVAQNMFSGSLPASLASLTALAFFSASRTYVGGPLSEGLMSALTSLVKFDISHCSFEGPLPPLGTRMTSLKTIQVENNQFTGSLVPWFEYLKEVLEGEGSSFASGAELYMGDNSFSGQLPSVLYDLVYSADFTVNHIDLGGNHLRCDKHSGSWPTWALRLESGNHESTHMIGRCTPVPMISSVYPAEATEGDMLSVSGLHFLPSEEAVCMFTLPDGTEKTQPAAFLNISLVYCEVPQGMFELSSEAPVGKLVHVTVANFGVDFYSPDTVALFVKRSFRLVCPAGHAGFRCELSRDSECSGRGTPQTGGGCLCDPGYKGKHCGGSKPKELPTYAVVLIIIVVLVAASLCVLLAILIARERKGDPVFAQLTNPLLESDVYAMQDMAEQLPAPRKMEALNSNENLPADETI